VPPSADRASVTASRLVELTTRCEYWMYDQWITLCPRNRRKWEPVTWEQILGKSYMQKGYKASVEQGAPHSAQTYLPHIIKRQARTYRCMACPSPEPRGDVQYYICCLATTSTSSHPSHHNYAYRPESGVRESHTRLDPNRRDIPRIEARRGTTEGHRSKPRPTITAAPPNRVEDRAGRGPQQ
jgi:hypothetical protein